MDQLKIKFILNLSLTLLFLSCQNDTGQSGSPFGGGAPVQEGQQAPSTAPAGGETAGQPPLIESFTATPVSPSGVASQPIPIRRGEAPPRVQGRIGDEIVLNFILSPRVVRYEIKGLPVDSQVSHRNAMGNNRAIVDVFPPGKKDFAHALAIGQGARAQIFDVILEVVDVDGNIERQSFSQSTLGLPSPPGVIDMSVRRIPPPTPPRAAPTPAPRVGVVPTPRPTPTPTRPFGGIILVPGGGVLGVPGGPAPAPAPTPVAAAGSDHTLHFELRRVPVVPDPGDSCYDVTINGPAGQIFMRNIGSMFAGTFTPCPGRLIQFVFDVVIPAAQCTRPQCTLAIDIRRIDGRRINYEVNPTSVRSNRAILQSGPVPIPFGSPNETTTKRFSTTIATP